MENLDQLHQKSRNSQSPTHSRPAECCCRQAIQARPDHPKRVVSPSGGLRSNMQQVAPASNRPICHEVQQQVAFVSPVPYPLATAVDALSLPWEDLDAYAFPPATILGKVVEKLQDSPCKRIIDCSMVAQHTVVLGSSGHVQSDPAEPLLLAQPVNTALQSDPSQKSDKPKSPCMAPRAASIKKQGFFEAVAARIEAPQRGSIRSVYEAKWTIFIPQPLRAVGVLFSPMVSGWAGGGKMFVRVVSQKP